MKKILGEKTIWRTGVFLVMALFGGMLAMPAVSYAAPPVVKTVPWVASNPLIPHDTWDGKQITLKGTTDVQGTNIQYAWDFGDGSPVTTGTVTNMYAVQAFHTYTGNDGDIFTARLTIQDTDTGETGSKVYYVAIRNQTLEVEVNVAIDEGLWWLHKTRVDTTCGGLVCSYWNPNYSSYAAPTAASINAFEANGHLESGDPANPYVETVERGFKFLFTRLVAESISPQLAGNPDSNGNSIGIRANESYYPYISGAVMDAIITSGTPTATTVTGGTNIIGRQYSDIVQDLADSYAYGQVDSGYYRGGWRYGWNSDSDNSAAQWGPIGMIPAERNWGLMIPPWVKSENLNYWLVTSRNSANGGFGYTNTSSTSAGTASAMVQLAFDGVLNTDSRWLGAENWLRNNWTGYMFPSGADYYVMFAFTKAMRLANPNPIVNFGTTSPLGPLDWYNHPTDGFARRLVNKQNADGSWSGGNRSYIPYMLATPWSILILGKTLFEAGAPVAVAAAIPNPGVAGQTITLDGSGSFHQDAGKSIDSWDWDLDNMGGCDISKDPPDVPDASGPVVTNSWPAIGDYAVTLCVSDDETGSDEKFDDTTIIVRITTPPIAPTADANGPYVFCPQSQPWFLDGTGSVNPDEGVSEPGQPGDTIQEYAWELDGVGGDFDEAFGPQPDVTAFFTALGVGNYLIQLKVTDTTATSFPSSGFGDLSDTTSAQVSVKDAADSACVCVDDLTARAKSGKVQLTWTDTGAASYNVYRGTSMGGPYMLIANTTSTYSTYLDIGLTNGVTYYYVVREVALNTDELCQSSEVSATPIARVRTR